MEKITHNDSRIAEDTRENSASKEMRQNKFSSLLKGAIQEYPTDSKIHENVLSVERQRDVLVKDASELHSTPTYQTTRIYEFDKVLTDFGLQNGPITRLVHNHAPSSLPNIVVVHGSQMSNPNSQAVKIGRTIFISHQDFESWIKQDNATEIENKILELLTAHMKQGNHIPA